MEKKNEKDELQRARPADEGTRKDPHVRDESGIQPGVSTVSQSKYDGDNQRTSRSGGDGFKTPFGEDADRNFEQPGDE